MLHTVGIMKRSSGNAFFGTTNDYDSLNDPTGNRRFLPITVNCGGSKNMWDDLTDEEVDQIWAEEGTVQKERPGIKQRH
ncbi:hypothetical protein KHA80_12170 [Anaerobacillus sp. HL2]|nr:hypothetical protein KHA80_12170 [Anaerobacillus sp. HL2]